MENTKIKTTIKNAGYIASEELVKKAAFFEKAGKKQGNYIPCMLLTGEPGSGKTLFAEVFAKAVNADLLFVQMHEGMDSDALMVRPNISAIIKADYQNATSSGILVKALEKSAKGPVVVCIDEMDKADAASDALLLDFLQNGRVTDGHEEWKKGSFPVWCILTSNGFRELSDALLDRCRKAYLSRPTAAQAADALGIPEEHHAIVIYKSCEWMTMRQLESYLDDINYEDEFSFDAITQYLDAEDIRARAAEEEAEEAAKEEEEEEDAVLLSKKEFVEENNFYLRQEATPLLLNLFGAEERAYDILQRHPGEFYIDERHKTASLLTMDVARDVYASLNMGDGRLFSRPDFGSEVIRLYVSPNEVEGVVGDKDDDVLAKINGMVFVGTVNHGGLFVNVDRYFAKKIFAFEYQKGEREEE